MEALPRIFFSTNDPADDNRYGLDFPTSLRDIAALRCAPSNGMRVLLYDVGEVEGTLEWDVANLRWLGPPDWTTERWEY